MKGSIGMQTDGLLHARLHPGCTVHSNYLTPRLDTNKGDRDTGQQSLPDLIPQLPV
jgi:hypothetical protein